MIAISQILRSFFTNADIKPVVTVEAAEDAVHEKDVYQGLEFLDDHIRTTDQEADEMNGQSPDEKK